MLNQEANPAEQTIPAQTKLPQGDDYGASSDIDSDKNIQIKGLDDSERPNLDGKFTCSCSCCSQYNNMIFNFRLFLADCAVYMESGFKV